MYTHRPFLSLVTVMMPLLGIYLLLCGPKKKLEKKSRGLRSRQRRQRQEELDRGQVENIPAANTPENEARRRNVNRTSEDNDNIEDAHTN